MTGARLTTNMFASTKFGTDRAPHLVCCVAADGTVIHANDVACRAMGKTREQLISMSVTDLGMRFGKLDWPQVWERVKLHRSHVGESSWKTPDGADASCEVTISYEEQGGAAYAVLVARDPASPRPDSKADEWGEQWYAYLVENTLDIITVLDTDLRIRYVSPSSERVLGYRPEEVVGKSALRLVHPRDSWHAMTLIKQALESPQRPTTAEVRLRHKDGSWRYHEAVGKGLPASAPFRGLLINVRDITERRRVEQADQERHERLALQQEVLVRLAAGDALQHGDLKAALRQITYVTAQTLAVERVGVWLYDDDRTEISCIDLYQRSTRSHSSGVSLRAADYPSYFAALETDRVVAADDAVHDPRTEEFDDSYLRPLGITAMLDAAVRLRGRPVGVVCAEHVGGARHWTTEDQNFVGSIADLVSLALEAEQRDAAEQALRRSEAQYRALVEHATYGIYRSTPEGRFLAVNPALVEMLGYDSEEEVLALDIGRDVYSGSQNRAALVEKYSNVPVHGIELEWRRKNGTPLAVRLSGRPVHNDSGELECFEMIAEDISKHRWLEEQLRQAQKMEAVGQLTGGIAHDFNNMLSVVMANAELVANALEPDQVEILSDVQEIQRAAQKTAGMVKQLLGFSRRATLSLTPVDLGEVVRNLSSMLSRVIPENIAVRVDVDPVSTVEADIGAIEQMLLNLATNARDAMPQGGVLRIRVKEKDVDATQALEPWMKTGRYVCIAVSDDGVGMDQDTCNRVFEPFFTTKPQGVGTGLGMAMVYGLTKQHGGFVQLRSRPGMGTTVRLLFPVVSWLAEKRETDHARAAELAGGTETILLVEDEESLRRTGTRVLERFGYTVLAAADGQEGLDLFRRHRREVDLVISDVVMPRMGGWQLYESLRKECSEVRFLMASGYGETETTSAPEGANVPFVQKPWTVQDLLSRIRQIIEAG